MKIIILVLILLLSGMVIVMSFFDVGKAYVFSPTRIAITLNQEPLKGAKVIRRWSWNNQGEDHAFTNDEGVVELPEVRRRGVTQFFPAEFVTGQQIMVVVDGKEERIWSYSKRDPGKNAELGGKPLVLNCELSNEEKMYRDFGPPLLTKCMWSEDGAS
ncbi:hypothetical protein GCM10007160_04910 [Litchfieldella qijiaojingensis]|uniref:DUF6795 domain-containing protein n=1 Tax=Litchfieldella qijiaojingensis TaxID=980347 RepID=A0ABQ2YFT7_9GAMM|nr:DUF6795 domain-containing protein [Halomonas qijiaojingensis]GGX80730.1 hypothetical protein GCM10007160_04910 [Halomonas qijiaojingensis]